MNARLFDGRSHVVVLTMRFAINEKRIFPIGSSVRSLLDVAEIDRVFSKHVQNVDQRAGFIGRREHDRRFIVTGTLGLLFGDDKKAGDVVGMIFNVFEDGVDAVDFPGQRGTDCRHAVVLRREFNGGSGT